jgi:protoporphyrinogen oxidase|tara:strand:- start:560 stop:1888 length:1329 start_codon:yes stop_codon:yes gene_type:complete
MNVGIIGSGISGLSAAKILSENNFDVTIYETSQIIGGQLNTKVINGVSIESFYHHAFSNDKELIELIEELNLSNEMKWLDAKTGIFNGKRLFKFVSPFDLLKFTDLSFIERLKLGYISIKLQFQSNWNNLSNVSAMNWISHNAGKSVYLKFWQPIIRSKFGKYCDSISMAWLWGRINSRISSKKNMFSSNENLGYLSGTFGLLINKLGDLLISRNVKIFLNAHVVKIKTLNNQIKGIEYINNDNEIIFNKHDYVLFTGPSSLLASLVDDLNSATVSSLNNIKYQSAQVLLISSKKSLTDYYWLTITDNKFPFLAIIEQTNFLNISTYKNDHVMYFSRYVEQDDPLIAYTSEQLIQHFFPFIKLINNNFLISDIKYSSVTVEKFAQPIVDIRYNLTLLPHELEINGLYVSNNSQIYPFDRGQSQSIKMAYKVAKMIIRNSVYN